MRGLFVFLGWLSVSVTAFDLFEKQQNNDFHASITNGKTALPGQFPYQIGLVITKNDRKSWCGGSLIGTEWVLTAAHCISGASRADVYLGATDRTKPMAMHRVTSSAFIIHTGWDPATTRNDIALIKIPVATLGRYIALVQLPPLSSVNDNFVLKRAIASGWGRTSDASSASPTQLQYAVFTIIKNDVCKRTYGRLLADTNICTSTPNAVSTCYGDSGGPLVLISNKQQVGIVSFGSQSGCEKGLPAVFTRVTSYLNWIATHTGIRSDATATAKISLYNN